MLKSLFNLLISERTSKMFYLVQRRLHRADEYTVTPHFLSSMPHFLSSIGPGKLQLEVKQYNKTNFTLG